MHPIELVLGCFAFVASLLVLVQLPMLAVIQNLKAVSERRIYRIAYAAGQLKRELKATLVNLCLDTALFAMAISADLAKHNEANVLTTFAVCFVWFEVWFYVSHRALHTRLLWPIHRLHHESKVTNPLTAMSFSVAEGFVSIGGLLAGVTLLSAFHPISYLGVAVYYAFLQVINFFGHSNIEVMPPSVSRILFFWTSPTHHAMHHSRVRGNYGLMLSVFDRWFGTEFEDYKLVHKAAYAKSGLTALGLRLPATAIIQPVTLAASVAEDIRSGRLALNADRGPSKLFQTDKVYQAPEVAAWLSQELTEFSADVSLDLLRRFDAQQCAWYLQRQDEIFGPMALNDLSELKTTGALRTGDLCFSLQMRLRAQIDDLPMPKTDDAGISETELFFNRRQPRTLLQHVVTLKNPVNVIEAMTMDVSVHSSAIYTTTKLKAGDRYQVQFSGFGGEAGLINSEAVVVNVQPFGDGYRCGLTFVNRERRATAKWGLLIKKSRTLAA